MANEIKTEDVEDLSKYVEGGDGIFVIRAPETCRSWNGIKYQPGLSAKNTPAQPIAIMP